MAELNAAAALCLNFSLLPLLLKLDIHLFDLYSVTATQHAMSLIQTKEEQETECLDTSVTLTTLLCQNKRKLSLLLFIS